MKRIEHKFVEGKEYKRCSCCKEYLLLNLFSKGSCWDKLQNRCKLCINNHQKTSKYKELRKEARKRYNDSLKGKTNNTEYRRLNKNIISERNKKYRENNKDYITKRIKVYHNNPKTKALDNARNAKRRALKLQQTPQWVDLEKIKVLYEKAKWLESVTGLKYHVDHVVPLNGKEVRGLHCWNNLQILEASINISKGNK